MGNILVGIIMIGLGLSGKFVLIGTNSPLALAGVGVIFIIVGIFKMVLNHDPVDSKLSAVNPGDKDYELVPIESAINQRQTQLSENMPIYDLKNNSYIGKLSRIDSIDGKYKIINDFSQEVIINAGLIGLRISKASTMPIENQPQNL